MNKAGITDVGSKLEMIRWSGLAPDEQQLLLQRPVSYVNSLVNSTGWSH